MTSQRVSVPSRPACASRRRRARPPRESSDCSASTSAGRRSACASARGQMRGAAHHLLDGAHRERRAGEDVGEPAVDRRVELGARHDLVDEAHRGRLRAAVMRRPVSSMPIACRNGHLALQQRHAAIERQAPDARLRQAEASPSSAATTMSQPSTISKPPPSAWPLTRAMTGTSSVSRSAMPPKPPGRGIAQYSRPDGAAAALHVGAGAEGALAGAGQHDARGCRGRASIAPRSSCSSRSVVGVDGVQHLRPVDRDPRDVVGDRRSGPASGRPSRSGAAELGQHLVGVLAELGGGMRIVTGASDMWTGEPTTRTARPRRRPPGSCR